MPQEDLLEKVRVEMMNARPDCIRAVEGAVEIFVKVVPGASRDRIAGPLGDALKIQVAAPPEKGKANKAVVALIADALGVNPKDVAVAGGYTSPRKTIRVEGVTIQQACEALGLE